VDIFGAEQYVDRSATFFARPPLRFSTAVQTIRFDPKSELYWSLSSIVSDKESKAKPAGVRNTLALLASPDMKSWTVRRIVATHPDARTHGFQYVDWQFDGTDIIAACRIAFDDEQGGAHSNHDANFLTFHRVTDYARER
jgi:hypothetical protein